jgi:predicted transcriptional regulator of viral defense system
MYLEGKYMLYTHNEIKNKYKSTYQIRKALKNKEIFKIDKGIYSDISNVHHLEVIMKKYSYGIFTSYSAYYYHNLTDVIPNKMYLATNRNATTINSDKIQQIRMKDELYNLGKTEIEYEGIKINIYDKERMLIDLARNKNQIGYDLYKEIIANYRKQVSSLDTQKIEEYLQYFVNGDKIFEIIQDEVF